MIIATDKKIIEKMNENILLLFKLKNRLNEAATLTAEAADLLFKYTEMIKQKKEK